MNRILNIRLKIIIAVVVCFGLVIQIGIGQPMIASKQLINDFEIYKDFKKPNLFYYGPGDLKLAEDINEKPLFQLLEMRYTGTSAYADVEEKRFLNVVQFTVLMNPISRTELKTIKNKLGGKYISLRPLPVKNVEAILVAPVEDAKGGYQRIGKSGSFQAESSSGKSSKSSYWTERTFTLKLENHEAQLLWDQVETGKLALSFGYAFYADVMSGGVGEIKVTGNSDLVDKMDAASSDIISADTSISTQVIKSNAFPIYVDVNQWPGLLKKIDINEEVPPAYAALEVKCYDFADNLRPDLALKTIEIHAIGVSGTPIKLPSKKFMKGQPDLHTLQIRFPYAVKMDKPLRYKVSEYTLEGNKIELEWVTKDSWSEIIDITTPVDLNQIAKKELEIEADPLDWIENEIQKVQFIIKYSLNGKTLQLTSTIEKEEALPLKTLSFQYDKTESFVCQNLWYLDDGTVVNSEEYFITDDYKFLDPPEF